MEEQKIDESKILSYEEEKKIKDQNNEIKDHIHAMQVWNDDIKEQTLPIAGIVALGGGITHAVSWLYKHLKLNSQARSDYINSLPQNPDQEATLNATKEALQNTYGIDTTGLTYSNIVGKVKDIFDGCYTTVKGSFGNSETIIKDGFQNFYVDARNYYRHGDVNSVFGQNMDSVETVLDSYPAIDAMSSYVQTLPYPTIVALLMTGVFVGPSVVRHFKIKSLNKKIAENEKQLLESEEIKKQIAERKRLEKEKEKEKEEKTKTQNTSAVSNEYIR